MNTLSQDSICENSTTRHVIYDKALGYWETLSGIIIKHYENNILIFMISILTITECDSPAGI